MLLGFIDNHTLFGITHLFGVVIGAGGAFTSDLMFLSTMKDKKITTAEMRFLRLGSRMVWIGLAIIIISGAVLFLDNVDRYIHSSKFLAKMVIVSIIIVNGFFFHIVHIPCLSRNVGKHLPSCRDFVRRSPYMMASGAISLISWVSAIVLGSLRGVPYSFSAIFLSYLVLLAVGVGVALLLSRRLLPVKRS
jgi:hypothetical protein